MRLEPRQGQSQTSGGLVLNWWDWPAAAAAPARTALLLHATGFHSRVWDVVVRRLPVDWRVIALDLRGHGYSDSPKRFDEYGWEKVVDDVEAFITRLELRDLILAGHSMGGAVATLVTADLPDRVAAALLIDPVIMDRELATSDAPEAPRNMMAEGARKRRRDWPSPEAMEESYRERGAFVGWDPDALHDYCLYGLIEEGDHWRLACEPQVEAWVFENTARLDPWPRLPEIARPIHILRAGSPSPPGSVTSPRLVEAIRGATEESVSDCNHFIPMRQPDLVAERLMKLPSRS